MSRETTSKTITFNTPAKHKAASFSNPAETVEQETFVQYVKWKHYPIFSIPNGFHVVGANPEAVAKAVNKLKKEGMSDGVPDLCIPVARGSYHGLYIEMKRRQGGTVSPEQKEWIKILTDEGYLAVVCHGAIDAENVFNRYIKLKEMERY